MASTLFNGLLAYYKLDSNANDSVGSNNGTINGSLSFISGGSMNNYASGFVTGATNYIDLPLSLMPTGNNPRSFAISVYLTSLGASSNSGICYFGQNTATNNTGLGLSHGSTGVLRLIRNRDFTNLTNTTYNFTTNNWVRIVVTFDGTTALVYVNGTPVGSAVGALNSVNDYAYLGRRPVQTVSMEGGIDEVGIWNRALTPAEVTEYSNGTTYPFPDLITFIPKMIII